MTLLNDLFDQGGQSPWIDNIQRSYITKGTLQEFIDQGVRVVTSNPTIFEKAITSSDDYDEQFTTLVEKHNVEESYWELAIQDITDACGIMRQVYDASGGNDGFVSIEVSPALALDGPGTEGAARDLWKRIDKPNLMVKIPATEQGIDPIHKMIAEGVNINVTLIFGLGRYEKVIEAYISGLEKYAETHDDLSHINSVASFFISRVDTEVDRRLDASGSADADALRGKAAVANAKLAYALFQEKFSGPRWEALVAKGAKVQRPLWASTSTKNPAYAELLYVDSLIGPDTVNTMPDKVVVAFADHGTVSRTVDQNVDEARETLSKLADLGVDIEDVAKTLENEGVASFTKSYDQLLQNLADKYEALRDAAN